VRFLSISVSGVAAPPPLAITDPGLAAQTNADLWIGLAIAAVVLVAAAAFARLRSRQPASAPPRRLARIAATAGAFAAAMTLMRAPALTTDRPLGAPGYWDAPLAFALLAAGGLILFGLLDLLLGLFRPQRVARWLALAALCFLAFGTALVTALLRYTGFPFIPDARQLLSAAAIVAAALVWWSWLPPPRQVAQVFE
jgi:hypothetical protein